MGVEIRGMDKLRTKIGKLTDATRKGTENAVYEMTQEVSGRAVGNLSSIKHGSGELVSSVKDEVESNSSGNPVGHVWTDKKEGLFRELGTGPNGEKSDKSEISPLITPVYTQRAWFFPVTASVEDLTVLYGIPKVEIQGVEFYVTSGQPARPWLYPALKYVEENLANEIVKRNVSDAIRKGLK